MPLIPRASLFGNPTHTGARISPDGHWLSWLAPRDGVLNVWVAPADAPDRARPLTAERGRPIRTTWWSPDSRQILYLADHDGDENFLLQSVDIASGVQRNDTPFDHAHVRLLGTSPRVKDAILLGIDHRGVHRQDVYRLDLAGARLSLVLRNDRYDTFLADADLVPRLARLTRDDGSIDYLRLVDGRAQEPPVAHVEIDDALTTAPLSFSTDGKTLFWLDSRGRDTAALVAQDVASGRLRTLAADARADIDGALFDPVTGLPQAVSLDVLTSGYQALDTAIAPDLALLQEQAQGEFTITSRSDDDQTWIVAIDRVTTPLSTWLYDRRAKRLVPLYVGRSALADAPLVPMQPQEIRARDGLALVAYLSLPRDAARGPVPMVLLVHGGPWERDSHGYNSVHQWLANRGYAVLSVNFRGSAGFGKAFIAAGDGQWGRRMQDDLADAVDWAVRRGVTTRDKVAIMGASYGGYAALAGLAFTPAAFACGVDVMGPSSLPLLLQAMSPDWGASRQQLHRRVGDPTTADGLASLAARSPLNAAARIRRPLLVVQGANDPRVGIGESDRIVAALAALDVPVTYLVFPDEGHGLARPANNIAFLATTESFLGQCLGGRVEPFGDALRTSSAEVRHGARFTPGLAQASGAP